MMHSLAYLLQIARRLPGSTARECPCCDHRGRFRAYGLPPRFDAACPLCGSLERHRLFVLLDRKHRLLKKDASLLHFAPEPALQKYVRAQVSRYTSADLFAPGVDLRINVEHIPLPDESFDQIICSHVLEHVDDMAALSELHRILAADGQLFLMLPIVEGWDTTYEDAAITAPQDRELHFGQYDHLRYYGRDVRARMSACGFEAAEYVADGAETVRYGLVRGERLFVCEKSRPGG